MDSLEKRELDIVIKKGLEYLAKEYKYGFSENLIQQNIETLLQAALEYHYVDNDNKESIESFWRWTSVVYLGLLTSDFEEAQAHGYDYRVQPLSEENAYSIIHRISRNTQGENKK